MDVGAPAVVAVATGNFSRQELETIEAAWAEATIAAGGFT